jgi:outer membrane biogenesis lipoprotein LolB
MRDEVRNLFLIPLFLSLACSGPHPASETKPGVIWQHVGSWSGRGDVETNSFPGSSGYFRFTWETSGETRTGEGRFKLILGSSISGRALEVVVDSKGASHDVGYVSEDPRTFYIKVESANENWKLTVDEGFSATVEPKH